MSKLSSWKTILFVCVFSAASAVGLRAQNFTVLYNFIPGGGGGPQGRLVQGSDGNLYGTTPLGTHAAYCPDPDGCGTVFKMTPGGTLTTFYSFCSQPNCADGEAPEAGLVLATDGNFYGTNTGFGSNFGAVFKLTPGGVLTTLHTFQGSDGGNPNKLLLQARDGNFYGTTADGNGTIFKVAADGTFTTLHSFNGADGAQASVLIQANDGNLYGTTAGGGSAGTGTLFKITTAGTLTTLYNFCAQTNCTDGANPFAGLVQGTDGNFYGTTYANGANGGGTVFKFTPEGVLTTLYSFCAETGCTDGSNPVGLLQASDGNFYGTTSAGQSGGVGTIFRITAGGTLTTLHIFSGFVLANDLMQASNGNFYGTTRFGGSDTLGMVFSLALVASASVSPSSLSFGNQGEGTTSAPQPVTLSNTGAGALTITGIAASANFGQTNACGGSLASGSSCTIDVTFEPLASGPLTGTLTITDNTAGVTGSVQTVTLSGTSTTAAASISPASLKFRPEIVGRTSRPEPVTLTNAGSGTLIITSIATSADFGETNHCGGTIAPGGSCTIDVTFSPTAAGTIHGTLAVTDNAANSPQTVALSGTGVPPVTLSGSRVNFGDVGEGSPSRSRDITLTNNQAVPLAISHITLTNHDYSETNTCNGKVAAKGTCTISVTLKPSVLGADDATLSVNDNASNTPQTATLTGTGILPATLSRATVNFGDVGEKSPSTAKEVKLTNRQTVALTIWGISTASTDFRETNTCGGSLAVGGQCTITITFTPSILGPETAKLTVLDPAANCPQTVTLTGTGVLPATLSETRVNFGSVEEKSPSTAKDIILTNRETVALNITRIATGNPDFKETNTCGGSVAARGHCTITVTFTPSIVGVETGKLTVDDAASNTPQTASLSGTGK